MHKKDTDRLNPKSNATVNNAIFTTKTVEASKTVHIIILASIVLVFLACLGLVGSFMSLEVFSNWSFPPPFWSNCSTIMQTNNTAIREQCMSLQKSRFGYIVSALIAWPAGLIVTISLIVYIFYSNYNGSSKMLSHHRRPSLLMFMFPFFLAYEIFGFFGRLESKGLSSSTHAIRTIFFVWQFLSGILMMYACKKRARFPRNYTIVTAMGFFVLFLTFLFSFFIGVLNYTLNDEGFYQNAFPMWPMSHVLFWSVMLSYRLLCSCIAYHVCLELLELDDSKSQEHQFVRNIGSADRPFWEIICQDVLKFKEAAVVIAIFYCCIALLNFNPLNTIVDNVVLMIVAVVLSVIICALLVLMLKLIHVRRSEMLPNIKSAWSLYNWVESFTGTIFFVAALWFHIFQIVIWSTGLSCNIEYEGHIIQRGGMILGMFDNILSIFLVVILKLIYFAGNFHKWGGSRKLLSYITSWVIILLLARLFRFVLYESYDTPDTELLEKCLPPVATILFEYSVPLTIDFYGHLCVWLVEKHGEMKRQDTNVMLCSDSGGSGSDSDY